MSEKGPVPSLPEPSLFVHKKEGKGKRTNWERRARDLALSLTFHLCRGPSSREVLGNPPELLPTSNLMSSSQMLWALPFKYTQSLTCLPPCTPPTLHGTTNITTPDPSTGLSSPRLTLGALQSTVKPNTAFLSSEPSCGFSRTMVFLSQRGLSECFSTVNAHWMLTLPTNSMSASTCL